MTLQFSVCQPEVPLLRLSRGYRSWCSVLVKRAHLSGAFPRVRSPGPEVMLRAVHGAASHCAPVITVHRYSYVYRRVPHDHAIP
jgi:hypothetical protein